MTIDGITYEINWRNFKRGRSFTIPCLDPDEAKAQILAVTNRLGVNILMKVVIFEGIRGLRVWRM